MTSQNNVSSSQYPTSLQKPGSVYEWPVSAGVQRMKAISRTPPGSVHIYLAPTHIHTHTHTGTLLCNKNLVSVAFNTLYQLNP